MQQPFEQLASLRHPFAYRAWPMLIGMDMNMSCVNVSCRYIEVLISHLGRPFS